MARGPIVKRIKKIPGQKKLKGISGIAVRPTEQDVKIAEGLAKGKSKFGALTAAGISEANARSNSSEICSRPGVLAALDEALVKAHVGVDRIAQVIDEGLSAMKVVSVKPYLEFIDYPERRQTARLASELMDLFPAQRVADVTPPVQTLKDAELDERINKLLSKKAGGKS